VPLRDVTLLLVLSIYVSLPVVRCRLLASGVFCSAACPSALDKIFCVFGRN